MNSESKRLQSGLINRQRWFVRYSIRATIDDLTNLDTHYSHFEKSLRDTIMEIEHKPEK